MYDTLIGEGDVMAGKNATESIRADGINIQVYTNDFENDFISLSDIATTAVIFINVHE